MLSRSSLHKFALGHGLELASVVRNSNRGSKHTSSTKEKKKSKDNNETASSTTNSSTDTTTDVVQHYESSSSSPALFFGLTQIQKDQLLMINRQSLMLTSVSSSSQEKTTRLAKDPLPPQIGSFIDNVRSFLNKVSFLHKQSTSSNVPQPTKRELSKLVSRHTQQFSIEHLDDVLTILNKIFIAGPKNDGNSFVFKVLFHHQFTNNPHHKHVSHESCKPSENLLYILEHRFANELVDTAIVQRDGEDYASAHQRHHHMLSSILFNLNNLSRLTNGIYKISDQSLTKIIRSWSKKLSFLPEKEGITSSSNNNSLVSSSSSSPSSIPISTPDLAKTIVVLGALKMPIERAKAPSLFAHNLLRALSSKLREAKELASELEDGNGRNNNHHHIKIKADASANIIECAAHYQFSGNDANVLCEELLTAKTIASMDLEKVCSLLKSMLSWKDAPQFVPSAVLEALTMRLNVSVPTTADEEEAMISCFGHVIENDSFANWPQLVSALSTTIEPFVKNSVQRRHRLLKEKEKYEKYEVKNKNNNQQSLSSSLLPKSYSAFFTTGSSSSSEHSGKNEITETNPTSPSDIDLWTSSDSPTIYQKTSKTHFRSGKIVSDLVSRTRQGLYTPPLSIELKQMLFDMLVCELTLASKKQIQQKLGHERLKQGIATAVEFLDQNPEVFVNDPLIARKFIAKAQEQETNSQKTKDDSSSVVVTDTNNITSQQSPYSDEFLHSLASPLRFLTFIASHVDDLAPKGLVSLVHFLSKLETEVIENTLCYLTRSDLVDINLKCKERLKLTDEEFKEITKMKKSARRTSGVNNNNNSSLELNEEALHDALSSESDVTTEVSSAVESNNTIDQKFEKFMKVREQKINVLRKKKQTDLLTSLVRNVASVAPSLPPRLYASSLESLFSVCDNKLVKDEKFIDEIMLEHMSSSLTIQSTVNHYSTPDALGVVRAWGILQKSGNDSIRPNAIAVQTLYDHVTHKLVPSPTAVNLNEIPQIAHGMREISCMTPRLYSNLAKRFYELVVGDVGSLVIGTNSTSGFLEKVSSSTVDAFSDHHLQLYSMFDALKELGQEFTESNFKGSGKFKECWRLIREFLIESATTKFDIVAVVKSANAFAMLNSGDRAVFGILSRRLCTLLTQFTEETSRNNSNNTNNDSDPSFELRAFCAQHLSPQTASALLLQLVVQNSSNVLLRPDLEPVFSLLLFKISSCPSHFEWYPNDAIVTLDALIRFYSAVFDLGDQNNNNNKNAIITQVTFGSWHRAFEMIRSVLEEALTNDRQIRIEQAKDQKEQQAIERGLSPEAIEKLHEEDDKVENTNSEWNQQQQEPLDRLDPLYEEQIQKMDSKTILSAATSLAASSLSEEKVEMVMIKTLKLSVITMNSSNPNDDEALKMKQGTAADTLVDALACVVRLSQKQQARELQHNQQQDKKLASTTVDEIDQHSSETNTTTSPSYVQTVENVAPFAVRLNQISHQITKSSSIALAAHSLASIVDYSSVSDENSQNENDFGVGLLEWSTLSKLGHAAMRLYPEKK